MSIRIYQQIFFDLDHTLWDFETNSRETLEDLYQELGLKDRGIKTPEEFHRVYNHYNLIFWDRFRKGFINRDELRWKRMWRTMLEFKIADEKLAKDMSERYLEILPTKKKLFHDTIDILEYLKAKSYPIHLITNGFEKTQHAKMKNSGIDHYFTHVITSEAAGIMKPHVAIFEYAMEKAGAKPHHCIMIGDTLDADIEGANNAGIDTVYFNPSNPANGDIQPKYVIENLGELKKLL
ncbi:MAG: YjjG family noncanonical pyrimidine nucleotidase [Chitinophagaceae bacterium]